MRSGTIGFLGTSLPSARSKNRRGVAAETVLPKKCSREFIVCCHGKGYQALHNSHWTHIDGNSSVVKSSRVAKTSIVPDCEAGIPIADSITYGMDVLVLGRGRRGRVDAALTGARARRAQAALVLVNSLRAVHEVAEEARDAYPEAKVVVASMPDEGYLRKPARSASNHAGPVVVVGTCMGVGDAFLQDGKGRNWLKSVELLVLFDVRFLSQHYWINMIRTLVRAATEDGSLIVAISDSLEKLPKHSLVPSILRQGYKTVQWRDSKYVIDDADTVIQRFASVSPPKLLPALAELIEEQYCLQEMKLGVHDKPHKVIVFFQTARLTQIFAEICRHMGLELCEVHSGKTKSHCAHEMTRFQSWRHSLLFTSDKVTEGAELADVTCVIQVGLPRDAAQYKRRIQEMSPGGSCITLLLGYEVKTFVESGCMPSPNMPSCRLRGLADESVISRVQVPLSSAQKAVSDRVKENAYASWLSCHIPIMSQLGWTQEELVRRGWQWALVVAGLEQPPALPERVVQNLGLSGVDGIDVITGPDPEQVRKQGVAVEPDIHGKYKKRKPRGRFFYTMQHLVEGDYDEMERNRYIEYGIRNP